MASIEIKNKEKLDTSTLLEHIKQLQVSMNRLQTTMNKLVKKQKIDIESMTPIIATAFDDDFIKQVCYENDVLEENEIRLVIIYEHDDFAYSNRVIIKKFIELEDQFPDIRMDLITLLPSEVGSNRLNKTTTIFKRE